MKIPARSFYGNFFEKLKDKKEIIFEIIAILLIALFSYSIAPKTFQNDTYYSVPIGDLVLENGIDMQDHFSWHENLPYTYPHWLFDVITSLIYKLGGWGAIYIAVCLFSILLGITIYLVNQNLTKSKVISFLITIGSMYLLKDYIAARAQLVTFLIYMIVIYCIEKLLENPKKIRYSIGIILSSILIANLHVAVWPFLFVLSLPYIAEYIIACLADVIIYRKIPIFIKKIKLKHYKDNVVKQAKIQKSLEDIYKQNEKIKIAREEQEPYKIRMKRNKNVKWLILVMIICAFTGLLTPLKTTPYTYLYKTMIGNTVKNINEHLPLTLIKDVPIMSVIIIIISLITFTKVKIRLSDLFMLGGLTYLMFSSKRQSTMFVLVGSIILNRMIVEAIEIYSKYKIKEIRLKVINFLSITAMIVLVMLFSMKYISKKTSDAFVNESTYPVQASDWILENLDVNNIKLFNEYNYGSYLLFRGIPVFIDSRADLYAPEFNKTDESEGKDIFMDFINTSGIGQYYGSTFEKYGITHVILYKNSKISMLIKNADSEKYNKLYSDDHFIIYEVVK